MRTAHLLTVSQFALWRGVYLPGVVPAWGGVPAQRGVYLSRGVTAGRYLPGVCVPARGIGGVEVYLPGGTRPGTPSVNRMPDRQVQKHNLRKLYVGLMVPNLLS